MKPPRKDRLADGRRLTRRGLLIMGAQLGVAGVLAARLRQLQVSEAQNFRLLAEENRINIRLIAPARGPIFDRFGVPIAVNEQNYRAVIVREEAGDLKAVLANLARIFPLSREEQADLVHSISRHSPFVPVTVADRLTWQQVAQISINAPVLPGVTADVGLSRQYPLDTDFAHVVGYVGPVSDYDLSRIDDQDPLLQIPRFQIGKSGVERKMEHPLRGTAGFRRIEVNAVGRVMRELDRTPGEQGREVQLTMDNGLQNFAAARLGDESAATVVMDVRNGDVLASVSSPSFDPNAFVKGISVANYQALTSNDHRPLQNKTVGGTYPPGSTFKMVVALAALEAGVIEPSETVRCPGYYELGNRRFHCWKRGGHGRVNLVGSLAHSCDVYYYEVAQRVGIEAITAMARRLGLGKRHDIEFTGIAEGLTPTKAWKLAKRGESWKIGDTLNAGIGQGFVLASPFQLALMASRIATGKLVKPRLIKAVGGVERAEPTFASLGIAPGSLEQVRTGMFQVSNRPGSTAYRTRIAEKDMRMAGKTGTSQVRRITKEERARGVTRNKDLPWERRDHALFVAFAPFDDPKYAISVIVEHGGGGSHTAAPIARDIMLRALYGDVPPLAAYPAGQRRAARARLEALELRPALQGPAKPERA